MDNQMYSYISHFGSLIKRRWPMMLSIFLITLLPSILFSVNKPVHHRAKAQIMLEQEQRANIELSGNLSERAARSIIPLEKLNSLAQVLTSSLMIERMIDKLGRMEEKVEKNQLTHHFQSEIDARVIPASTVIEVSYSHADPIRAVKVVNTLVEVFQEYYRGTSEGDGAIAFYQNHLDQISARLAKSLGKLEELRREEGIQDDFQRVQENTNQRIEALKVEQAVTIKKIGQIQTRVARLQEELNSQPEYVKSTIELTANPKIVEIEQKLTSLELERASLSTKYTDESPEMMDKTAEIESIRKELSRFKPLVEGKSVMVLNQLHEKIEEDLIAARTELAGLQNAQNQIGEQLRRHEVETYRLNRLTHRFISLENEVATEKKMHGFYLGKMDSARFVDSMNRHDITSLRVIEKAEGALPNRMPLLSTGIASLVLSLFLSIGVVFLMETIRPRLNNPEQAKTLLKLPVLASISKKAA
jgi:uncharacterized protein involved in exopolysaccharide biosynthesis